MHSMNIVKLEKAPLFSPNADTAGQKGYNVARAQSPQQATWATPTTAGDNKLLYGQGRPMAKSASGAGADMSSGTLSKDQGSSSVQVSSRLFFDGTVAGGGTANDLSRLTDAREKGRIGILGSALSYAGSYGRVTSELLGCDLNPLGRGDGGSYVAGGLNLGRIAPRLPWNASPGGWGNSVNNCGQSGPGVAQPPQGVPGLADGGSGGASGGAVQFGSCGVNNDKPACCCCNAYLCGGEDVTHAQQAGSGAGPTGKRRCYCPVECSDEYTECTGEVNGKPLPCTSASSGGDGSSGGGGGCPGCGGGAVAYSGRGGGGIMGYPPGTTSLEMGGTAALYENVYFMLPTNTDIDNCFKECGKHKAIPLAYLNCLYGCLRRMGTESDLPPLGAEQSFKCDNIASVIGQLNTCLFPGYSNPLKQPTKDRLKSCFMKLVSACGCDVSCKLMYSDPAAYNLCFCQCCHDFEGNKELTSAPGTTGAGIVIAIVNSEWQCLCEHMKQLDLIAFSCQ
jgi:hypothetical protein